VTESISKVALASLLTEFFLRKSLGMLNAPLRLLLRSQGLRARAALPGPLKKSGVSKSYILSVFFKRREKVRGALLGANVQRFARVAHAR
jgi:hypothetical protein